MFVENTAENNANVVKGLGQEVPYCHNVKIHRDPSTLKDKNPAELKDGFKQLRLGRRLLGQQS